MIQVSVDLNHALFFIHDKSNNDIVVPEIDGVETNPIKSENCIMVFAQHAVDGQVSIGVDICSKDPEGLIEVFNDFIAISSGVLSLTDPEDHQLLEFTLPKNYASISIWVDQKTNSSIVQVLIKTLDVRRDPTGREAAYLLANLGGTEPSVHRSSRR